MLKKYQVRVIWFVKIWNEFKNVLANKRNESAYEYISRVGSTQYIILISVVDRHIVPFPECCRYGLCVLRAMNYSIEA